MNALVCLQGHICKALAYCLQQTSAACVVEGSSSSVPAPGAAGSSAAAPCPPASIPQPSASTVSGQVGPQTAAGVTAVTRYLLHPACFRVVGAVQLLLDSGDTAPVLLRPLLCLLLCCLKVAPSCAGGCLQDLVDVLLGWCLDPEVTAQDRYAA